LALRESAWASAIDTALVFHRPSVAARTMFICNRSYHSVYNNLLL